MRTHRSLHLLLLSTLLLAGSASPPAFAQGQADSSSRPALPHGSPVELPPPPPTPPAEWIRGPYEVLRVVDGDTLHVRRDGRVEKLRLLSVDTEEKLGVGPANSASKPGTVFGEETSAWARELFESFADGDGLTRVRLVLPGGHDRFDVYGRLLCHVLLPDGRDFNLLLVSEGKSPYFTKYGYSDVNHGAFVAAQRLARAEGLGIWNPDTNRARTADAPSARRPYDLLLPWWEARARALDDFRRRRLEKPLEFVSADSPADLALAAQRGPSPVSVFGEIDRLFDEADGSSTVLLRGADRRRLVRVRIAAEARAAHLELDLEGRRAEYRQNFLYVRGILSEGERGFELRSTSSAQWSSAEPQVPEPARAAPPAESDPLPRARAG